MSVVEILDRNDSLLVLSTKSEAFLRSKFTAYIADLKRQEQQAIKAAERAALNAQLNAQSALLAAQGPVAGANTGRPVPRRHQKRTLLPRPLHRRRPTGSTRAIG
ncbi:MAG: hypothetical protein EBZ31_05705, partial [Flavobacteriia bacterium]|nr:hypothetical protein [Flavobacteriia bacterium]